MCSAAGRRGLCPQEGVAHHRQPQRLLHDALQQLARLQSWLTAQVRYRASPWIAVGRADPLSKGQKLLEIPPQLGPRSFPGN